MNLKHLSLLLAILLGNIGSVWAQIDSANATVQVLTYWNKGDKESYMVSVEKIKIKKGDTTSHELTTYDVDITVLDSTAEGYTVEWKYSNMATPLAAPILKKVMASMSDMRVVFKINPNGEFEEVVNVEEIRGYIQKSMTLVRKEMKVTPAIEPMLTQIEAMYSTKEAIESASIKDILQFHNFYGLKLVAGDTLSGRIEVANMFNPEKPFEADAVAYLDTINHEDNNYIVRSEQYIDQAQLGDAMLELMTKVSASMKLKKKFTRDDLPDDLRHELFTASRLHNDGWLLYSIQTTTVTTEDSTNIEERIIDLK